MTIDPYEILGVDKTAATEDIRSAFRQKAKTAHPDAGGNAEDFELLKRCENLLTDPERRAKYDATGEFTEQTPHNPLSAPLGVIIGFLMNIIEGDVTGKGPGIDQADLGLSITDNCLKMIAQLKEATANMQRGAERLRRTAKRVQAKQGKTNFIGQALESEAAKLEERAAANLKKIPHYEEAIAMLQDYHFDLESVVQQFQFIPHPIGTNRTF